MFIRGLTDWDFKEIHKSINDRFLRSEYYTPVRVLGTGLFIGRIPVRLKWLYLFLLPSSI